MPFLDQEKARVYQREWRVKHKDKAAVAKAKRESNQRVEGRYCVCSRPAVRIVDNQPVCARCLNIDSRTHEWDPELKYGVSGQVEAARPTRKHYYQPRAQWES